MTRVIDPPFWVILIFGLSELALWALPMVQPPRVPGPTLLPGDADISSFPRDVFIAILGRVPGREEDVFPVSFLTKRIAR